MATKCISLVSYSIPKSTIGKAKEAITCCDKYFCVSERHSTVWKEVVGGTTTFLTICYILVVNPNMLSIVGIPPTEGVIGTAVSAAIGSFIVGLFGNLPFAICPGLGLTAYVVYGMILGDSYSFTEAFTACLIGGAILVFLSVTGVSRYLLTLIPRSVRLATIIGMGLQIALAGMESVDILVANDRTIMGLGDVTDYHVWLTLVGLVCMANLTQRQYSASILLVMLVLTAIAWGVDRTYPTAVVSVPKRSMSASDFIDFHDVSISRLISPVITFLVVGVVDVGGCIMGLGSLMNFVSDVAASESGCAGDSGEMENSAEQSDLDTAKSTPPQSHCETTKETLAQASTPDSKPSKDLPGMLYAFVGCGLASMVSAAFGATPCIVVVESAVGIKVGAKTGLSACVVGCWFLVSLFLTPVLSNIPDLATAPISILLGVMMMSQALLIDWNCLKEAVPAFLTAVMIPFTFSVANGIIIGVLAAAMLGVLDGEAFRATSVLVNKLIHISLKLWPCCTVIGPRVGRHSFQGMSLGSRYDNENKQYGEVIAAV